MLALGSQGEKVRAWQEVLRAAGYSMTVDGSFGTETQNATAALQASLGVNVDGIVGPATVIAYNAEYPDHPFLLEEPGPSIPFLLLGALGFAGALLVAGVFLSPAGRHS